MIINLTQHPATAEQLAAGVVDPAPEVRGRVVELLTFDAIPDRMEMVRRALQLTRIAQDAGATTAMIGGAPYFMGLLEKNLSIRGVKPVYAFSKRESVEEVQPDGSVRKVAIFRHVGFVPA